MRSNIMQFTIRMIVAIGIAVVSIIAIADVVTYSSSDGRAWVTKQETLTSPARSPVQKAEFRLSEYQQLGGYFLQRRPLR